jgi:hypothetical protein
MEQGAQLMTETLAFAELEVSFSLCVRAILILSDPYLNMAAA